MENGLELDMGPAESFLFVFNKQKNGTEWKPLPVTGDEIIELTMGWSADFIHCREGESHSPIDYLRDLKDIPDFESFAGTVIYRIYLGIKEGGKARYINLGKVYGVSELFVNGASCGVRWYGRRIFDIGKYLRNGPNKIEVKVATSMGNYMKSLKDNPIAQYWTNEKNKVQPMQSMGLIGPVTIY
jgi:hypothetical protein